MGFVEYKQVHTNFQEGLKILIENENTIYLFPQTSPFIKCLYQLSMNF